MQFVKQVSDTWKQGVASIHESTDLLHELALICFEYYFPATQDQQFERCVLEKAWNTHPAKVDNIYFQLKTDEKSHPLVKRYLERFAWYMMTEKEDNPSFFKAVGKDVHFSGGCHRLECYYPVLSVSCTCGDPVYPYLDIY